MISRDVRAFPKAGIARKGVRIVHMDGWVKLLNVKKRLGMTRHPHLEVGPFTIRQLMVIVSTGAGNGPLIAERERQMPFAG